MGGWLPTRFIWWWRGSRIIHDECREVIHEFPFFSFMLADAHPHVLDLPFALLTLALALAMLTGRFWEADRPLWSPRWLALPLAVGALGFLNAWDLPTFAFVLVVAYGLAAWKRPAWEPVLTPADRLLAGASALGLLAVVWRFTPAVLAGAMERLAVLLWFTALYLAWELWRRARSGDVGAARALDLGRFAVWLVLLALLFYLPFHLGFRSQVTGIGVVDIRSRLPQWLVHFGLLTFLGATLVGLYLPWLRRSRPGPVGLVLAGVGLAVAVAAVLVQAWTALLLVVLLVAAGLVGLAVWRADEGEADVGRASGMTVAVTFALLCLAVGFLMPLGTEFLFVRDLFGSRMNTVFKLFFQAWVLLAVAGGFTFHAVVRRLSRPALAAWGVPAVLLVAASLVYPVAAVYNRTSSFTPPTYEGHTGLTLDGLAWWRDQHPDDLKAAAWLRANARGTPVILEAPGGGYSHNGRISLATGFPTVMGWDGHEHQWRGVRDEIDPQKADAVTMYTTADPAELRRLLEKHEVRYVIVGDLERGQADLAWSEADEARFRQVLTPVFTSGNTVIYERQ
jgi:YYY domain-containing protein